MSKKKIVILIIILLILAGLVWFFWPKDMFGWNRQYFLCDCFGVEHSINGEIGLCYGVLYNKQYSKDPSQLCKGEWKYIPSTAEQNNDGLYWSCNKSNN